MQPSIKSVLVLITAATVAYSCLSASISSNSRNTAEVDFVRDIQPILKANCEECHGARKAQSYLRFDSRQVAMKVITAGSSADSRLVHRIEGSGGEPRMPMGRPALAPEQIELIKRWIDQGAAWPDSASVKIDQHWAFVAPLRPALPAVRNKSWVRNPIDSFILAAQERNGLKPSPEAPRTALIRRLSLDLTGLPPSPGELDTFIADQSPNAYEKLVDRLLASPHYGERWGRWWLDAARYADTNGFEKDRPRSVWPYRDWVIKAFNKNLPFDQFTIEQLAGDLLPEPTLDQRVATGFLRNSMQNEEGGVDPEQFRVEGLIDRVDAVGKAFLGLTVNCAQCHTHKFDPIPQRDYYRFLAFLNSDDEPEIEVPDEKTTARRNEILSKVTQLETDLISRTPDLKARMTAWEAKESGRRTNWTPLTDAEIFAAFGVKFDKLEDGSFIARGDNATANNYVVKARTSLTGITGFRIELLSDKNLPRGGPGRSADGTLYFSEFIAEAAPAKAPEAIEKIPLVNATADLSRPNFPVANIIDGNMKTHWSSDFGPVKRNQDRNIVIATGKPAGFDGGTVFTFQLAAKFDEAIAWGKPNIGRFRLSVTTEPNPEADRVPSGVRRILGIPGDSRTAEQKRQVFSYYRSTVADWADANQKIDDLIKEWPYGPTTLALDQRLSRRATRIFKRGDWKNPGDEVEPGTPSALHPFPKGAPRNRLGLARWIVDRNNPLTARVIVNRVWHQVFGQGFVGSPEDFGTRCDLPSHPELLDWLAVEFRDGHAAGQSDRAGQPWDLKHLLKVIVMSATYRQTSNTTPELREKDPFNRWLAHSPRVRVDAEIVRDVALAASGLLSSRVGGPSFYPPIPDGVLTLGYGGPMPWPTATGEERYRRGLYIFWKRSVPYPSLLVFDEPNGDFSCTRRIRSNTPLQSLTTLNDTVFMEAAQGLAMRVWKEGGPTDREKMTYAFRLCTARKPDLVELTELLRLLQEQRLNFKTNTASAVYVSSADVANLPDGVNLHDVAPWTMVARVLLNLDETMTRE